MNGYGELSLRAGGRPIRVGLALAALTALVAGVAAGLGVTRAEEWGIISGVVGAGTVLGAFAVLGRRVQAGPAGLRFRTLLRWRRLDWKEIAGFEDLRVDSSDPRLRSTNLRVAARLRDGALVVLPVPYLAAEEAGTFHEETARLRALRRGYADDTSPG
ncbi:PH domain-containing protein [Streptomyces sp. NPDC006784]|uniref:PH domain-containing protein n=1 Tax=Streptomyces sp. NPDC006784 TaxID=3364764 RepID=UPI0036857370